MKTHISVIIHAHNEEKYIRRCIHSTRKYDDLGDWLYFKLLVENAGTFIKAAFGDKSGVDKILDEMFYEYNDRH